MNRQFLPTFRAIVAAAWRRRYMLVVPFLVMLPLSLVWALYGPRTYVAKSLMLLQEATPTNPLARDNPGGQSVQIKDRMAGLQALLKSDRVLGNVYRDLAGDQPGTTKDMAAWIRDFSANLSVDLIGTDFLEFQLKGGHPRGLGKQLEAVTSRFLEALLPEQNALFASQVLLEKRKEEFETAERALASFRSRIAERLPEGWRGLHNRLAEARTQLQSREALLQRINQEISDRRARLPTPSARIDQQITRAREEMKIFETKGGEGEVRFTQVKAELTELVAIKDLEDSRTRIEAEVRDQARQVESLTRSVRQAQPLADQQSQLEREVAEAKEAHDEYARRFTRASLGRGAGGVLNAPERIKLIDPPRDPQFPTSSALRIALAALLASLMLGLGLSIIAELLDPRIRSPEDAAEATGLPILARLT